MQELEGSLPGGRADDSKKGVGHENKIRREDEPPPAYPGPPAKGGGAPAAAAATSSTSKTVDAPGPDNADSSTGKHEHKGLLGKIKDKAIGTKEEREEKARQRREAEERYNRLRQERLAMLQSQGSTNGGLYGRGPGQYAAPNYPYGQGGGGMMGGGGMGMGGMGGRGMGGGGMGMGMPLMGGLAGGTCPRRLPSSILADTRRF